MKANPASIQKKALLTVISAAILIAFIGLMTWTNFNNTLSTLEEFESQQIPDIRNVFLLSEEVAKIAALAPYIANTARPFQLQTEKIRPQQQYELAQTILQDIKNEESRSILTKSLKAIQINLNDLYSTTQRELYAREDALTILFNAHRISDQSPDVLEMPVWQPLISLLENISLKDPSGLLPAYSDDAVKNGDLPNGLLDYLKQAKEIESELKNLAIRKSFLLASLRAHSEKMTEQTNYLASVIQKEVLHQQAQVTKDIYQTLFLISAVLIVLVLFVIIFLRYSQKLASDLATVSDDMRLLVSGYTAPDTIPVSRKDEIGTLVEAYYGFREHAISAEQTKLQLVQQNNLLETVFNNIQDGLSVFSRDNRMVTWNERYLSLFNIQASELYSGMPLAEAQTLMARVAHRNIREHQILDINTLNDQRHLKAQTFERHFENGKIVEFRSHPMPSGGFVTLYSDITAKRAAENKLQHTQKMEVLGQLTGGVAHDFNNLLAALMGNLQLIHKEPLTQKTLKYLQRAQGVSERGKELVQRLLAFGRKQHLMLKELDVDQYILDMEDLLQYSVPLNVRLTISLQAQGKRLLIDASQLENALLNLVLNAADAIPGQGVIDVSTCIIDDEVQISVKDNGLGIPESLQEKVLEPFFTTKAQGQGSGLGLSTVYGFVSQSGGKFKLTSVKNKGTTVTMIWPMLTGPSRQNLSDHEVEPLDIDRKKEVVILEDDRNVAQVMLEWFQVNGFKCRVLCSAELFFDQARQGYDTVGLVITDVNLAGEFNGLDVITHLKKYAPDVPYLVMSGLSKEQVESDFGVALFNHFVQKPILPETYTRLFLHNSH
ncbi:MAG: PAS-domain containing protein [Reinekea sp.]